MGVHWSPFLKQKETRVHWESYMMRRHCLCTFALLSLMSWFALAARVAAEATPTATTLAVTSDGARVSFVASGSVVALTATVKANGKAVTLGQVNFCKASATYCTDINRLGTTQLTSVGTAVLRLVPGIGKHSYKAVFAGTPNGIARILPPSMISF
jgi:hypothetical protein